MDRYDDFVINTERQMRIKINYIHFNPVKANIVTKPEDYLYSSARNYYLNDQNIIEIATDWSFE